MDTIKIKINDYENRMKMIGILASEGYIVWIDEEPVQEKKNCSSAAAKDYYVCFREKRIQLD